MVLYTVCARSHTLSQKPAPITIASRSPISLGPSSTWLFIVKVQQIYCRCQTVNQLLNGIRKKAWESGSFSWVHSQDLITEFLFKKGWLTVHWVWVLVNFRVYLERFLLHDLLFYRIGSVIFRIRITFSLIWGLPIKQRKTNEAKLAPFLVRTPIVDFRILLDVIRKHGIWHTLRTRSGSCFLQRWDTVVGIKLN